MKTQAWYKAQHKYAKSEKGKATSKRTYQKNKEKTLERKKDYSKTKKAKILAQKQGYKYRKNNSLKIKCRRKINYLIQKSYIQRDICSICGKENAEFHHFNYNLPYCGIWFCKEHHALLGW